MRSAAVISSRGAASVASVQPAGTPCLSCWGFESATVSQGLATAINHLFNSAFNWLSSFPANPISDLFEGALVLIRRTLSFVPAGVTATQVGSELTITVNTGSVAYFRTAGNIIEVAGDPGFSQAEQFDASGIADVTVSGGNAGCAGLYVTAGAVDSNLTTTGIDFIRFGSTAQFAGEVRSTLASGTLTLSQAVRGLAGVELDGDVRLANNVQIDAGEGDATFTGAVDGSGWFGGQSLTVTALVTTTFEGDVGSRTPLGRLTTQAITPLVIQQSPESVTIPLYYMPIFTKSGTEIKYGIDVALGTSPARRYLFDTGGNGFFAYYTPGYWDGTGDLGTDAVDITYSSGGYLDGYATDAQITIGTGKQSVSTGGQVLVSAVTASNDFFSNGAGQPTNPQAYNGPFAGDFGAAFGLQPIDGRSLYDPDSFITSPLFQLPENFSTGYLVQVGPIGTKPQLTVGLTDALKAQFPYAIPVSWVPKSDQDPTPAGYYPGTDNPLLEQFGIYPTYSVTNNIFIPGSYTLGDGPLQTIIDTGAGSTNVRLKDPALRPFEYDGSLIPGTEFAATFLTTAGRPALTWKFVAGNNGSVNQVDYTNGWGAAADGNNVNTGLNLFNDFDVMYDVADRIIWLRPNGGQSTVSLNSVTTRGDQSYGQNAVLKGTYTTSNGSFSVAGATTVAGNATVNARRGDVTFSGTVDSQLGTPRALLVNSGGATTFYRVVGSQEALSSLTTDRGGSTNAPGVVTAGAQAYGDNLNLFGAYSAGGSGFSVAGTTTLTGLTQLSTTSAPITFSGRVDSTAGAGYSLTVTATGSTTTFNGAVGSRNPLGGLIIGTGSTAIAESSVTLNGALNNSDATGLSIQEGATAILAHGGLISNYSTTGVVFEGNSQNSVIQGFTIADNVYDGIQLRGTNYLGTLIAGNQIWGNAAFGIETLQGATGLAIRGNTIGKQGTTNRYGYTTGGPNAHGIALGAGSFVGSVIADNTIAYNARDAIFASGGIQSLVISGNTMQYNGQSGIEIAGGDCTGTVISGNLIQHNGADGISLAPGVGQGITTGGQPVDGYTADLGHYVLPWSNNPVFDDPTEVVQDPQVKVTIGDTTLRVNVDTGSRGLYFDQNQLPDVDISGGKEGYVYLNSSNRLFFGKWVTTDVTFPESYYVGGNNNQDPNAVANIPVLIVTAIGASTTPAPGSTIANTTFSTTINSGMVTITNGSQSKQVAITAVNENSGFVTIPGGWWAEYKDNSMLGSVSNFGVGFDRTGLGTSPTNEVTNQQYNAFLNLKAMQSGDMRAGYVLSTTGVQLGLDNSVSGFAYTQLAPTGLSKPDHTPPDWQPATGSVEYGGQTYNTGPLVIDLGIPTGILTLPGMTPQSVFNGPMTVNLLNSGGAVSYVINDDLNNLLNPYSQQAYDDGVPPPSIAFFNPLAGAYTQNTGVLSQQFFNTGRRLIAAFDLLYDADAGYLGLRETNSPSFQPAYYANVNMPTGLTNLSIENNTIINNTGNGVTVNGEGSSGIAILSNAIAGNTAGGIALTNGANGSQPTPGLTSAQLSGSTITLRGTITAADSYTGPFQVQVFSSPSSDGGNVQGRKLLSTTNAAAGGFEIPIASTGASLGDWITVTVTPTASALNTSEFSTGVQLAR